MTVAGCWGMEAGTLMSTPVLLVEKERDWPLERMEALVTAPFTPTWRMPLVGQLVTMA